MAALVTTTLSSACSLTDTTIKVASATTVAAGRYVFVDAEHMIVSKNYVSGTTVPVIRGVDGTATAAHVVTSNVVHGAAADFGLPAAGLPDGVTLSPSLALSLISYTAAGAIAFTTTTQQQMVVLNSTVALAMTLANPTTDMDGILLFVMSNGKAAHTVTYTAGLGNAGSSYDVATFPAGGQVCMGMIACNGFWLAFTPFTGTLTSIFPAIA